MQGKYPVLQPTIPDYQIPFVPMIQKGEQPLAMMANQQTKYIWVVDTPSYRSVEMRIKAVTSTVIDPAIQKHNDLRLIEAREPKIRSAEGFMEES